MQNRINFSFSNVQLLNIFKKKLINTKDSFSFTIWKTKILCKMPKQGEIPNQCEMPKQDEMSHQGEMPNRGEMSKQVSTMFLTASSKKN